MTLLSFGLSSIMFIFFWDIGFMVMTIEQCSESIFACKQQQQQKRPICKVLVKDTEYTNPVSWSIRNPSGTPLPLEYNLKTREILKMVWDWRDCLAVKRCSYSSRGMQFDSQHPHSSTELSITPVLGCSTPLASFTWCTDTGWQRPKYIK